MRHATKTSRERFIRILWLLAVSGLLFSVKTVFASDGIAILRTDDYHPFDDHRAPQDFDEYYTIDRESALILQKGWEAVAEFGEELLQGKPDTQARSVALLNWKRVGKSPSDPSEDYNRGKHFGNWRRTGSGCVNVRGSVLIRDSLGDVQMRESGCSVESGKWKDPYTGDTFTAAEDMDIDHFVPLKNAWVSGGSKWARKKFCRYGNFLKNSFHLIPAYKSENRKKSDMTPADYMPPNREFHCEYAIRWLKIKAIWGLMMMPPEVEAIQKIIVQNRCDMDTFKMDVRDFDANQAASESDPICNTF